MCYEGSWLSPITSQLWMLVRYIKAVAIWLPPSGRQENQGGCIAAADGHVFGKVLRQQVNRKEASPLCKYRIWTMTIV